MLETERLRLREWQPGDREAFAQMNADPRVMEFFPQRLTQEESNAMVDRIEKHFRSRGFGLYAAELRREGRFVGMSVFTLRHSKRISRLAWKSAGVLRATCGGESSPWKVREPSFVTRSMPCRSTKLSRSRLLRISDRFASCRSLG